MFKIFKKSSDPTTLCVEARALISQGQVEKALNLYESVIRDSPQFSMAFADRGTLYAMMKEHTKATADLMHALELGYNDASVFTTLATIYKDLGDFSNALRYFSHAETMAPDNPFIYYNRSGVYLALGNKALAEADLKKCLELGPDANSRAAIQKRLEEVNA
ncbi:MAG TPA: tetratricopeptide repeat protein [Burkholderiaceae bacterium]|jgi:superkiller protein 3